MEGRQSCCASQDAFAELFVRMGFGRISSKLIEVTPTVAIMLEVLGFLGTGERVLRHGWASEFCIGCLRVSTKPS